MAQTQTLPNSDTVSAREMARAMRKAEWHAQQAARSAEWDARKACSFVARGNEPAIGEVIYRADLGHVRVVTIGRFGRVYCEPETATATAPTISKARKAQTEPTSSKSEAFWNAVQQAQAAYGRKDAPYGETPSYARRLTFINVRGDKVSVKQPATFRCPPAQYWSKIPAGLVITEQSRWTKLQEAEHFAQRDAQAFAEKSRRVDELRPVSSAKLQEIMARELAGVQAVAAASAAHLAKLQRKAA